MKPNSNPHLFGFELAPVEKIEPWGSYEDNTLSLSLYALTDGHFWISAGKETLLKYTHEIRKQWELSNEYADYQVACFAQDILVSLACILSPLPKFFEHIIHDESLFRKLRNCNERYYQVPSDVANHSGTDKGESDDDHYNAFRWLGERAPCFSYLAAWPDIWFVRVGNEIWIQWDNIDRKFEGIEVWTARQGTHVLTVEVFEAECRNFSDRLLFAMESRIVSIEKGLVKAQIPLDPASLRTQLLSFKTDFEKCFLAKAKPDIDWVESERALRKIARLNDIVLP
jgi:hypothetical protein